MSDTTVQDLLIKQLQTQEAYLKKHDDKLEAILQQVLKTNGRVNSHDMQITALSDKLHSPDDCSLGKSLIEMKIQVNGFAKMMAWVLSLFGSIFLFLLGIVFKVIKIG